jgi:peptide/nickel transport system permease protein
MKLQIKIWQFILLLLGGLLAIKISFFIDVIRLLFFHLKLFFVDFKFAKNQLNFSLIDSYLSLFLLVVIISIVFINRSHIKFFNSKINFTNSVIIILMFVFVFAPAISNFNPDFQKNLNVTKLLPPVSFITVLRLGEQLNNNLNEEDQFLVDKKNVARQSFDDSFIFVDSLQKKNGLMFYYQKNNRGEISLGYWSWSIKNKKPIIGSKLFLLGSDELGRDVFSRLIYGARISLVIGLGAVAISALIGLFMGFIAGYIGGVIDSILSRLTDMFLAFPIIFLIIFILAFFSSSLMAVIIVLGFSGWMSLFKIVRGEVISIKNKDYFQSSKLLGLSNIQLLFKEILPVIFAPVLVNLVFLYGNVILAEAALSYLGLGTGSIYPSWGAMIDAGQAYLSRAWWMILFPGLALYITLYTANKLGKEINQIINPRSNL